MKILVTGGAGFIGSHTLISLVENGYEVVVLDNLYNSQRDVIERVEKFVGIEIPFYIGDCCNKEMLDQVFRENKIDMVIHFAGLKAVGESCVKPLDYYDNNLNATISLLKSMVENNVNKLVFSSSATVYDEKNNPERVEGMTLGCTNPYGWTKYMGEQIIRDTVKAYPQLDAVLLRYFNPVGAHPSGVVGENPKGIPNNLMPYIQQVATGKREILSVYGDDYETVDGTGVRDYIHVCDLADAHVAACKYLESHHCCEEINIGAGKGVSVMELIQTFERVNGIKIPYKVVERRAGDLPIFFANASKAKELLGWEAKKTVEDMCKDAYHWQKLIEKN